MLFPLNKIFYLFSFLLVFCSCIQEIDLPLEEEKLVLVLRDIHIAEAGLTHLTGDIKDSTAAKLYQQIYTMHGVKEADVDSSLFYLKRNPDRMEEVYKDVVKSLRKLRANKE